MTSIMAEAKTLLEALENEEFVSSERLSALARKAKQCANQADPEIQRQIMATINQLIKAMELHLDRTKSKLTQLQSNRRSLKKFGHLRKHSKGQRYYNTV